MTIISYKFRLVQEAAFRGDLDREILSFTVPAIGSYRYICSQAKQAAFQYLADNWIDGCFDLYLGQSKFIDMVHFEVS